MRLLLISFFSFFFFSCAEKNSGRNPAEENKEKLNNFSSKDTVLDNDRVVVSGQDSLSNFPIKDDDSIVVVEKFYKNLSYTNNFKLVFYEHLKSRANVKHYWTILIYDKKMNMLDSVVQPAYVFYSWCLNLDDSRSYITGVNKNKTVENNDHGDFVVADFNFDLKNDFAIKTDISNNGGAFYSYYIQYEDNNFVLDEFLTDSMTYFPSKINKRDSILVTYVHAGVCWLGEHIFKLGKNNKWSEISYRELDVCKEKD